MNTLFILAQASGQAAEQTTIVPIDLIWEQISTLTWLQASYSCILRSGLSFLWLADF